MSHRKPRDKTVSFRYLNGHYSEIHILPPTCQWWVELIPVCNELNVTRTFNDHSWPRVSEWVKVAHSCLILCNSMDSTAHGILQARILKWIAFPFSGRSSQPRDQTEVSLIAGRLFTSWATKGSPSTLGYILQRIFPTQGSDWSLLHGRRILYQLSHQWSLEKINRKQTKTDDIP